MQIFSPLVGVSFRGAEARTLVKSLTPDDGNRLSLEADPDNEYDDHAVRVICDGMFVGFLARENNTAVFEALANGAEFSIEIVSFENSIKPVLLLEELETEPLDETPEDHPPSEEVINWGDD